MKTGWRSGWARRPAWAGCGSRARAPSKTLATLGSTLDETGQKLSKTLGNTVEPHVAIAEMEMIRLLGDRLADRDEIANEARAMLEDLGAVTLLARLDEVAPMPTTETVS